MSLYIASNYRVKLDKSLEYGISVPSTWQYIKGDTLFNLKWPKIIYKNQQQKNTMIETPSPNFPSLTTSTSYVYDTCPLHLLFKHLLYISELWSMFMITILMNLEAQIVNAIYLGFLVNKYIWTEAR